MIQLRDPHEWAEYARDLVSKVVERTGYPVEILEQRSSGMGLGVQTNLGKPTKPYHVISYDGKYVRHRLHFIVNGLSRILRIANESIEDRVLPAVRGNVNPPEDEVVDVCSQLKDMPEVKARMMTRFLYQVLVRQLTNTPSDIRVEQEIEDFFPEHRKPQREYLRTVMHELESYFKEDVKKGLPIGAHRLSSAMNYVRAIQYCDMLCTSTPSVFLEHNCSHLGEHLKRVLKRVDQPGYGGDRIVVDRWAEELGLRDWYEWRRIDEE